MKELILKLEKQQWLSKEEWLRLLTKRTPETEEFLWIFKTAAYRIPIEGGTTIDPVCTIYLENGEKIWIYERGGQVFKVCYVRDGTKTRSYFIKSKLLDVFLEERWDSIKTKGA